MSRQPSRTKDDADLVDAGKLKRDETGPELFTLLIHTNALCFGCDYIDKNYFLFKGNLDKRNVIGDYLLNKCFRVIFTRICRVIRVYRFM